MKWTVVITGSDLEETTYTGVEAPDRSKAVSQAIALWMANNADVDSLVPVDIKGIKVNEEKEDVSHNDTTLILDKLDEMKDYLSGQLASIWRAIDRVNDTIAEKFEGEEDLGEITKDDIGPSDL